MLTIILVYVHSILIMWPLVIYFSQCTPYTTIPSINMIFHPISSPPIIFSCLFWKYTLKYATSKALNKNKKETRTYFSLSFCFEIRFFKYFKKLLLYFFCLLFRSHIKVGFREVYYRVNGEMIFLKTKWFGRTFIVIIVIKCLLKKFIDLFMSMNIYESCLGIFIYTLQITQ